MKRKIMTALKAWKENNSTAPLLLVGARQTGKTYILKQFCREQFDDFLYANFEEHEDLATIFEHDLDPREIVRKLAVFFNRVIDPRKTVIFFDEIQLCEKAVTSLKYFNEAEEDYKIVCAGSLLGVALNRSASSFPVGKVFFMSLFPMDLGEFFSACGEELLKEEITSAFEKNRPLPEALHRKALELYKYYLCVGGMPQAVREFLEKDRDVSRFDRAVQKHIILAYLADMAKYCGPAQAVKNTRVYNSMPRQLAREHKKFMYTTVEPGAKKESYESAIHWLLQADLLLKSSRVDVPQKPLSVYEHPGYFKLFVSDVGLLAALADIDFKDILFETSLIYKGMLTENYVAQALTANGRPLYYWQAKAMAEVDFLIRRESGIVPIEVKASDNTRSRSLESYVKRYAPEYSIRVSAKNFGFSGGIRSIPLYAAYNL